MNKPKWTLSLISKTTLSIVSVVAFLTSANARSELPPLAVNLATLQWSPLGGGNGFPVGVRTAQQGVDPITGGVTYYALFPAGSHFDLHWHSHDEYVVVVQGKLSIELGPENHELEVGSYVVIPGSMNHSWSVPETGEDAVILVRRAGPADFHFVDNP